MRLAVAVASIAIGLVTSCGHENVAPGTKWVPAPNVADADTAFRRGEFNRALHLLTPTVSACVQMPIDCKYAYFIAARVHLARNHAPNAWAALDLASATKGGGAVLDAAIADAMSEVRDLCR